MNSSKGRCVVRLLAIVLSAGAIWVSFHLTSMHVLSAEDKAAAKKEKNILDQACTALLANADCEEVMASPWGSIQIGGAKIPTALLGLDYFIFLFCWYLLVGQVPASRLWVHLIVACLSAAGVGMSIFLLYQMSKLPKPCSLCMITHIANFLLFGCILLLWPKKKPVPVPVALPAAEPGDSSLFTPVVTVPVVTDVDPPWSMLAVTPVVAVLAITAATFSLNANAAAPKIKAAEQARDYYKKQFERYDNKWEHLLLAWQLCPSLVQPIGKSPIRGPADARHTVIVYSDFQCPTCREFERWFADKIQPIAKRHGGLKVVFKYWPICTDCNPKASRNLHQAACRAALAAEAAYIVGGNDAFWRMHDILFTTQDQWSDKTKWKEFKFETYAKQIGLDADRFIQAMNSDEAMQHVKADITQGSNLGKELISDKFKEADRQAVIVDSTPAVYIDNKKLAKWSMAHTWLEILKLPAPEAGATLAPATAPQ